MSTKLSMTRDINSYNAFGIFPTYDIYAGSLAAGVAQSIVVPSNEQYWLAIFTFTPGASIWVDFASAATTPTTTVGAFTSVLNPAGRQVKAGSTISFITADATVPFVCVEFQIIAPYAN